MTEEKEMMTDGNGKQLEHAEGALSETEGRRVKSGRGGSSGDKRRIGSWLAFVLLLAAIGASGGYWAAAHHVLRTDDGVAVLNKRYLGFENTTVDVRGWTHAEFAQQPTLSVAMRTQGYGDLIPSPPVVKTESRTDRWRRQAGVALAATGRAATRAGEATKEWAADWNYWASL